MCLDKAAGSDKLYFLHTNGVIVMVLGQKGEYLKAHEHITMIIITLFVEVTIVWIVRIS